MALDLHDSREEIRRCADALSALLPAGKTLPRFEADLRLAADAARALCTCEPAAWGDAPGAIARLLLPHQTPNPRPSARTVEVSYWALHLFALLSASPTIRRALIEVAPAYSSGDALGRLRKRLDEVFALIDGLKRQEADLSPYAKITLQLIALNASLVRAAIIRESVDLRLVEYSVTDIEERAKRMPGKSEARTFQDLAERANAAAWETHRLIQAQGGASPKRVA